MRIFKRFWVHGWRRMRDEYEETQNEIVHCSTPWRFFLWAICSYCLLVIIFAIYWSFSPAKLEVRAAIHAVLVKQDIVLKPQFPAGVATTASLIAVTEKLWGKKGGYLANDLFPPGIFLDDMPNWEVGVMMQVRDMIHTLRASFSQASAHVVIDDDLQKAEVRLHFDYHSWVFPATETQYQAGTTHLKKYLTRLVQPDSTDAYFYADAQHLNDYLAGVEQRLKNLSQRLTASVGPAINTDSAALPVTQISQNALYLKTPWLQLDDIFHQARGSSWALLALLQGLEIDFATVLKEKNAEASYEQIIRELAATQQHIYSPIVLNGSGFGFVVNHSLVMASYLSRAQVAIADCRRLLLKPSPPSATP